MILLSSRSYTVPQIAAIFECEEATVRSWIARFEADGVQGLRDGPRSGRPRQVDTAAEAVIRQQVETPPAEAGYAFGFWTVVTLASHLAAAWGLRLSRTTVRRTLVALARSAGVGSAWLYGHPGASAGVLATAQGPGVSLRLMP